MKVKAQGVTSGDGIGKSATKVESKKGKGKYHTKHSLHDLHYILIPRITSLEQHQSNSHYMAAWTRSLMLQITISSWLHEKSISAAANDDYNNDYDGIITAD